MKKKALICTVVIAAVVAIICALKLRQPDPTLFDKAMELEPGQLIGTDGSIWQTKESDGTARIVKTGKLKGNVPELDLQGKIPVDMRPYEFAVSISEEGSVYLDNTGRVWMLKAEEEGALLVEPFYFEEELPQKTTDALTFKLRGSKEILVEVENPDTQLEPYFVVGVLLNDGWHNLSKGSMETVMYGSDKRQYKAQIETPRIKGDPIWWEGKYRVYIYVGIDGEYYHAATMSIEHK